MVTVFSIAVSGAFCEDEEPPPICPYAPVGSAILYVYVDPARTVEAPKTINLEASMTTYDVLTGLTYYIRIWNVTQYDGVPLPIILRVKISWKATDGSSMTTIFDSVYLQETAAGIRYIDVDWTVPVNAKVCETSTVHFRRYWFDAQGKRVWDGYEWLATGQLGTQKGHLHVIPEISIGTIGIITSLFAALGIFMIPKKLRAKKT